MKLSKNQKERITKISPRGTARDGINLTNLLEDFVTDRFLIPEHGKVETIINTPESYFNMLIDFLEFTNNYDIPNEK